MEASTGTRLDWWRKDSSSGTGLTTRIRLVLLSKQ
jgi:hypothetical protein